MNKKWNRVFKVACKHIPVYSFRYLNTFNKFFENKFEKTITINSVKAQIISQIFEYLNVIKINNKKTKKKYKIDVFKVVKDHISKNILKNTNRSLDDFIKANPMEIPKIDMNK